MGGMIGVQRKDRLRVETLGQRCVPAFEVQVVTTGLSPSRVEVDFAGVDMNMGMNRPQLVDRSKGNYTAEVTLPVCITGQMDWQATVLVEAGSERIAVPFRFATGVHE